MTALVIMYSINVFVTFSLSMIGMCRHWWELRHENPLWLRRMALFVVGAAMCLAILAVTVYEKFDEGDATKRISGDRSRCFVCCVLIHHVLQPRFWRNCSGSTACWRFPSLARAARGR